MEWRKDDAPGKLGRMVARGIEDAFSCDLTSGPWCAGDLKAAVPLPEEDKAKDVVSHAISGFAFHGIPDGVLAGRREDRDLPILGKMDRREFGNAVHAVLARIRTSDDADRVLSRRWPWLKCSEHDWEKVVHAVRGVVASEAMAPWFDGRGKVYLERDLVGADGKMVRPDRVVYRGEEIAVIDFKTAEESDSKKRASHAKQVRGYMQALQRADGPQVLGLVYYVASDELVDIEAL
jgi:hypothetical protein